MGLIVIVVIVIVSVGIYSSVKATKSKDEMLEKWKMAGKVVCPNCNSDDLQAVSDQIVDEWNTCCNILICGICADTEYKSKTFWACKRCGHKFANIS